MNSETSCASQTKEARMLQIIHEIVQKSAGKDYIYRGESECYPQVCSSLYRIHDEDASDLADRENDILVKARKYLPEIADKADFEIFAQLQHYGGDTNLIDFTEDYLVAIFFACYKSTTKDGRVILLEKPEEPVKSETKQEDAEKGYKLVRPPRTIQRAESQKSLLVKSPHGTICSGAIDVVCILSDLKPLMIDYLRKHHGISEERIFGDIHGFIRSQKVYNRQWLANRELENGGKAAEKGQYKDAIGHYGAALELEPLLLQAYINRGRVYFQMGVYDSSIEDYTKALDCKPNNAQAYLARGSAYAARGDFPQALEDCSKAIELNPDEAKFYYHEIIAWVSQSEWDKDDLKVITDLNKAIELRSNDPVPCYALGIVQLCRAQYGEARQNLEVAKERGANLKVLSTKEVDAFEKQYDAQWPSDIKEMLIDPKRSQE